MIITKTPYRVSLFGGSTDYPSYYSQYGSTLIGFAINRYCYTSIMKLDEFTDINYQAFYSSAERVNTSEEIQNPGIRGTLQFCEKNIPDFKKLAIFIQNELPSKTGIGSSSSLIVGLLRSIYTLFKIEFDEKQLAQDAIYIERSLLKEPGGIQDQIWAAHGGFNSIDIDKHGAFFVKPLPICSEFINYFLDSSIMFYTKIQRDSYEIAESHNDKSAEQYKLGIHNLAQDALKLFDNEDLEGIGQLLDESWQMKKQISPMISNEYIDSLYQTVMNNGAFGCKLLGTGSGGFLFCLCNNYKKHDIIDAVKLPHIDIKPTYQGSKIIFNENGV
tara:strand:+ start:2916 stop:3905 length:990 start_codon:yes stop_codon:yes gene_type:complete